MVGTRPGGAARWLYALLVIGGLNTVLSPVYYVRVLKVMVLEKSLDEVEGRPSVPLVTPAARPLFASLLAVVLLVWASSGTRWPG